MKIDNSLRQECMPDMVYTICKLAGYKDYKREEIKDLITLKTTETSNFEKAFKFAIDSGFLSSNIKGIIKPNFSEEELSTFKNFRYKTCKEVYKDADTVFYKLTKWYLTCDSSIFKVKIGDLNIRAQDEVEKVTVDYIRGFCFWLSALGIGIFQKLATSKTMVFSLNEIMHDWILNENYFNKNQKINPSNFFNKLIGDFPFLEDCINDKNLNQALSMGLRVLHNNKILELVYTPDSLDVWHLTNSVISGNTNRISGIIVR